jgi:hypothetical protein
MGRWPARCDGLPAAGQREATVELLGERFELVGDFGPGQPQDEVSDSIHTALGQASEASRTTTPYSLRGCGGGRGIRTPGGLAATAVFKSDGLVSRAAVLGRPELSFRPTVSRGDGGYCPVPRPTGVRNGVRGDGVDGWGGWIRSSSPAAKAGVQSEFGGRLGPRACRYR